jgi:ABC-type lipoprotein release transport system permease subunit
MKKYSNMLWSVAWKNVWRNKKRSAIVVIAVTIGMIAGVFTGGLMNGWMQQRLDSVVNNELSEIQVHNPDFSLNDNPIDTIADATAVARFLSENKDITGFAERLKMTSIATTARGSTTLMLNGIIPVDEKRVSDIHELIMENGGTYFDEPMQNPIVISNKTAEELRIKTYEINASVLDSLKKLKVKNAVLAKLETLQDQLFRTEKNFRKALEATLTKQESNLCEDKIVNTAASYKIKSKIVFTYNDLQGGLVYQTYRVCGIFKTTNTAFDQANAFVLKSDLASGAGFSTNDAHEFAMRIRKEANLDNVTGQVSSKFPELSVQNWVKLSPEAAMMNGFMGIWYFIIMAIILLALAFGIINTMLMAILERTKELGMLMAIGMNRRKIFVMIMLETLFLTAVGAVIGMFLGWIVILVTGHTGINFSAFAKGYEAMGFAAIVYPSIQASFFLMVAVMVFLTGMLSSIIPARKALKLNPVEATRNE